MSAKMTGELQTCDQCRRRKRRCDKQRICMACADSSLTCTRRTARQTPGRKKGSGIVISALRSAQPATSSLEAEQTSAPALVVEDTLQYNSSLGSTSPINFLDFVDRMLSKDVATTDFPGFELIDITPPLWSKQPDYGIYHSAAQDLVTAYSLEENRIFQHGSSTNDTRIEPSSRWQSLAHSHLTTFVNLYFQNLHCRMPLLEEPMVRQLLGSSLDVNQKVELKCLLLAVCSASGLQEASMNQPPDATLVSLARKMFDQALLLRANIAYMETPTFETIVTSILLHVCCVELRALRSSRRFLQEALSDARELGIFRQDFCTTLEKDESIRFRRLKVSLFVMERASVGFQPGLITIRQPPRFPHELLPGETSISVLGFRKVFELFEIMDGSILSFLEQDISCVAKGGLSTSDYLSRQMTLAAVYDMSGDHDLGKIADIQQVNIQVTQQWLHLLLWQIALQQSLLSSVSTNLLLTYRYPVSLAQNLCKQLSATTPEMMLAHGIDLFKKVFDVAYSLMNIIALSPTAEGSPELQQLLHYLSVSPQAEQTLVGVLRDRRGLQS